MQACRRCRASAPDSALVCPKCGAAFGGDDVERLLGPQRTAPRGNAVLVWRLVGLGVAICCCCGLPLSILVPVFKSAKIAAMRTAALERGRNMAMAVDLYVSDHDNRFPLLLDTRQLARVLNVPGKTQKNPAVVDEYRWNATCSGLSQKEIGDLEHTWLFCSKTLDESRTYVVGFCDFHVQFARPDYLQQLLHPPSKPVSQSSALPRSSQPSGPAGSTNDQTQPQGNPTGGTSTQQNDSQQPPGDSGTSAGQAQDDPGGQPSSSQQNQGQNGGGPDSGNSRPPGG